MCDAKLCSLLCFALVSDRLETNHRVTRTAVTKKLSQSQLQSSPPARLQGVPLKINGGDTAFPPERQICSESSLKVGFLTTNGHPIPFADQTVASLLMTTSHQR